VKYLSVVNGCFVNLPAGAPRVAWDMCKVLVQQGHDVTMFCPKHLPDDPDEIVYEKIRVVQFELPKTRSLHFLKLRKYANAARSVIQQHLEGIAWDIVHIHVPMEGYAVYQAIGDGPKYVYTCHSPATMEMVYNWGKQGWKGHLKRIFGLRRLKLMEYRLLSQATQIQTLSDYTRRCLESLYGGQLSTKMTLIPHWCRQDFSRTRSKSEARKILGWPLDSEIIFSIRGMRERYGVDVAIRAVAPIVKESEKTFYMLAGHGYLRSSLEKLARDLAGSKIKFMGQISDQALKLCYEAADIFVLPSITLECFGLIVLEAFAYGLPVIGTDAGAIPELLNPILPNCIVPAARVDALEQKIRQFLRRELCIPSAETIQQYAQSRYGQEVIARQFIQWIQEGRG
jgi:glycosyltransferase involved in cell wall biosynthesis